MDAKVSGMFAKGTMDLFAVFAVGEHPALAKGGRRIQLAIFEENPLVGVFGFYFLFAE
jgi:hypothetical protein